MPNNIRNLLIPKEIKTIIDERKLKNIVMETGDKNIYHQNEDKFIVTKEFLSNTTNIFGSCYTLEKIDMQQFDFSKIKTMRGWFFSCDNLTEIIFPKEAECNQLTDLYSCFLESNLQMIDLSFMKLPKNKKVCFIDTFYASKVNKIILPQCTINEINGCFMDCLHLEEIIAPVNLILTKPDALRLYIEDVLIDAFYNCSKLKKIDFSEGSFNVEDFIEQINTPDYNNNLSEDCVIILPDGD